VVPKKRLPYFVGPLLLVCIIAGWWLIATVVGTPSIPRKFDPAGFSAFGSWSREFEEWIAADSVASADMRDRMIFLLEEHSGALVETRLSASRTLPETRMGAKWYMVDRGASSQHERGERDYTGTVVLREPANHALGFVLEPRRISLRYYKGTLVSSKVTRSDL
jgi:hypothetical protein